MFRIFVQNKFIENFKELNCFRAFSDVFSDSTLNRSIFERELDVGIRFQSRFFIPGDQSILLIKLVDDVEVDGREAQPINDARRRSTS